MTRIRNSRRRSPLGVEPFEAGTPTFVAPLVKNVLTGPNSERTL